MPGLLQRILLEHLPWLAETAEGLFITSVYWMVCNQRKYPKVAALGLQDVLYPVSKPLVLNSVEHKWRKAEAPKSCSY